MAEIIVYSTEYCPYCVQAKNLLKSLGQNFQDIMVDADRSKMAEMLQKSNGMRSVPQIFINSQHIGGCDELYALHNKGRLAELLK